jgi:PAS domain S-box-containing protein
VGDQEGPPEAGRDTVAHLEAVHRLSAAVVAATTVELIYEAALDALIDSLAADRAAILLFDPDGVIRFKASRGLSEVYRAAAEGHTPWSPDETAAEPIVIPDVAGEAGLGPLREAILDEGIGSLAFIPLLYGNRLLGKFMVYFDAPHRYRPEELALARTVAGHIAFALERRRLEDELRLAADQLEATLNAVTEGITVHAPDGTILLANQAGATLMGFGSAGELRGGSLDDIARQFDLFDEDGRPLPLEGLPGGAARRGEEPAEILIRSRGRDTGTERFALVRSRPVLDDAGKVRFAVSVFRDVTDRQLAVEALRASEARLAFLAAASRRLLRTSLEPRAVLEEAADLVVPELADWSVVREVVADGELARVAVRHADPATADLVARLAPYGDPLLDQATRQRLEAGEPTLVPELTRVMLEGVAADAEHLELLLALGVRSVILVPLRAAGRTIGALTLAGGESRAAYTEADLALAEEFAARVAATVDNARSYAREHATAETLARGLLPGRLPKIDGLDVAGRYRASGDVGGDFYDCFPTGDGRWMLVVGDVCGRGIPAASMTGLTRHTIRAAALHASSPAEVLVDLNRLLLEAGQEDVRAWSANDGDADPSFCTVCVAEVTRTPGGAGIVVSSGGHPLPAVVRADGRVEEVGRPGSLVGVLDEFEVSEESVDLEAGDALVLFTDGITERRSEGHLFEEQLLAVLGKAAGRPAGELARRLEEAAVSYASNVPDDDIAVLVLAVPRVLARVDGSDAGTVR